MSTERIVLHGWGLVEVEFSSSESDPSVGFVGGLEIEKMSLVIPVASEESADFLVEMPRPLKASVVEEIERELKRLFQLRNEDAEVERLLGEQEP